MINLLPDTSKKDIRAARANVVLLRYNFLTLASVAGLGLICASFYFVLSASQSTAVTKTSDNQAKVAAYSKTRQQADEYRDNLSIAKKILGNSVNYTSTIFAITKLLPSGVVLDSLTLNATDFGKQTTFSAHAKNYDKAAELKQNFQSSSLFTNVYFQNITESDPSAPTTSGYPIAVTLSAQLNKAEQ